MTLSYYTPRRKHWGNLAIGLFNEFLGFTLKAKTTTAKQHKWDDIELQTKETSKKSNGNLQIDEMFQIIYLIRAYIQKYMRHTSQGQKKRNNPNF